MSPNSLIWKTTRWHCQPEKSWNDLSQNSEILTKSLRNWLNFFTFFFYDAQRNRSQCSSGPFPFSGIWFPSSGQVNHNCTFQWTSVGVVPGWILPMHFPILTRLGWVLASLLCEGCAGLETQTWVAAPPNQNLLGYAFVSCNLFYLKTVTTQ